MQQQRHLYHISIKVLLAITLRIGIVTGLIQEEKGLLEPHLFDQFSLYLYVWKLLGLKFKMNSVQVRKQAGVCRFFFPP